jgi:hypothetical protein
VKFVLKVEQRENKTYTTAGLIASITDPQQDVTSYQSYSQSCWPGDLLYRAAFCDIYSPALSAIPMKLRLPQLLNENQHRLPSIMDSVTEARSE